MSSKKRVCEVCGSDHCVYRNRKVDMTLCAKHNRHILIHGEIKHRTRNDPNEIILYDDCAEVILYDKDCKEIARTIIDLDDVERVSEYKWGLVSKGYVASNLVGRLHRFIMKEADQKVKIDHINGNKLLNKKENLRKVTNSQNLMNAKLFSSNTSGVTGVHWVTRDKRWIANIAIDGKKTVLGRFMNKEDAIRCRLEAEKICYGEFVRKDKYTTT